MQSKVNTFIEAIIVVKSWNAAIIQSEIINLSTLQICEHQMNQQITIMHILLGTRIIKDKKAREIKRKNVKVESRDRIHKKDEGVKEAIEENPQINAVKSIGNVEVKVTKTIINK